MNLATRCFGHPNVPCDIAMVPLLDLVNHAEEQAKLKFFTTPHALNMAMYEADIERVTQDELDLADYDQIRGYR